MFGHRLPDELGSERIAARLGVPDSMVHRMSVRHDRGRLSHLDRQTAAPIRGCERTRAGELLRVDVKGLGRPPGAETALQGSCNLLQVRKLGYTPARTSGSPPSGWRKGLARRPCLWIGVKGRCPDLPALVPHYLGLRCSIERNVPPTPKDAANEKVEKEKAQALVSFPPRFDGRPALHPLCDSPFRRHRADARHGGDGTRRCGRDAAKEVRMRTVFGRLHEDDDGVRRLHRRGGPTDA